MKTSIVQQLTLLVIALLQTMVFSQTNSLELISEKYDASLKEQNKGIAILIKKDNKTEAISLGDFNLSKNSVFNIGSATKTFTSILILQEMEKGNLKLTDNIGTYLSPIANVDSTLTIESLLAHESGLDEVVDRNILDMFYAKNDSLYNDNLLYKIKENNPEMVGKFSYCNTNYFLLGRILEKVTDQSYFDLIRERIFMPSKMNSSYPYLHKNLENLAAPYHGDKDVSDYLDYRFFATVAYAAGSIASTLEDMTIFYTALFETEKLLKKESLQLMLTSGNKIYGLGIFKNQYNDKPYFGHGGNNIGYAFTNGYFPETKELYLMFTNAIALPIKSIENDVVSFLNNETIEDFKEVDLNVFKDYVGNYLVKEADLTLTLKIKGKKMYLMSEAQGIKSELNQKDENTLIEPETGVTLTIIKDDSNSLTFSQGGFTTTISKLNPEN